MTAKVLNRPVRSNTGSLVDRERDRFGHLLPINPMDKPKVKRK